MKTTQNKVVSFVKSAVSATARIAVNWSRTIIVISLLLCIFAATHHISANNLTFMIPAALVVMLITFFWFQFVVKAETYDHIAEARDYGENADDVRSITMWSCLFTPALFVTFFWSLSVNNPFTDDGYTFLKEGRELRGFTLINLLDGKKIEGHGPPLPPAKQTSTASVSWK